MENQLFIALRNNKLFKNIKLGDLNLDNIKGNLFTINEGEILYREGDPSTYIYFIVSGELNLLKKQKQSKTKSYIYSGICIPS